MEQSETKKYKGLTSQQVEENRLKYGSNVLKEAKQKSLWRLYLEKFRDPIIQILIFAAVLSFGLGLINGELIETIGILVAIFLATSISFYFEADASKKFKALNRLGKENDITVVRDGVIQEIKSSELVVGDIVYLEQGVEVPADGVLLEAITLQINESSLTGELSISKTTNEALFDKEATYPSNYVLRSTLVIEGNGVMEVKAVGDDTEIGKVAEQVNVQVDEMTPLGKQLQKLAHFISKVAIIIAIIAFFVFSLPDFNHLIFSLRTGQSLDWVLIVEHLLQCFMMSVTLIVMAVPEGLPMAVSLSLALNMKRMLKTNNLVRKLHACETMGAVTTICTDKTGTLTENKMMVVAMHQQNSNKELLAEAIATNTTAHLQAKENTKIGIGNPTECALLLWLDGEGADYVSSREKAKVIAQQPFSTEQKYMATCVHSSVCNKNMLYVKGAPEIVLTYCQEAEEQKKELLFLATQHQDKAQRTLLLAYKEVSNVEVNCKTLVEEGGLTIQALVGIEDPIREEVPGAVSRCQKAGINIKIVTGDTERTAVEIAKRIGLWENSDSKEAHITGPDFAALSDEEALQRVAKIKVMSRARPLNKQRLVNLLQQKEEIIAVTGDGTNDAPALNHAQVGLSMGTGTSVAKDASDITLLDDSFSSIATAVLWGRTLYKNIQRFVVFQLTINLSALMIVLVSSFFGLKELPLTVTQILWINIIMDTFAALALSTISPSESFMQEKPRKVSDFIITKAMKVNIIFTALGTAILLLGFLGLNKNAILQNSELAHKELTEFFTLFVLIQFWNLMNSKVFGTAQSAFKNIWENKVILGVMLLILIGQILIVNFGGKVFRTQPIDLQTWVVLFAVSSLVLWVGEIVRLIHRIRQ